MTASRIRRMGTSVEDDCRGVQPKDATRTSTAPPEHPLFDDLVRSQQERLRDREAVLGGAGRESSPLTRGGERRVPTMAVYVRIGEELRNVPKAAGRPAKILSKQGKNKSGRARHIRGNSTRDIKWLCVLPEITGKV